MNTPRFTAKLDGLHETLAMMKACDLAPLVNALEQSGERPVVAVGSGGSHIAASFFGRCRETLAHGLTLVQTPMQIVSGLNSLVGFDVWLFSASAENDDMAAAARAAKDRGCDRIIVFTRNVDGKVARWVGERGGNIVAVPVADTKDGFLATHSLLASVVALLLASDTLCGEGRGEEVLLAEVQTHLEKSRSSSVRQELIDVFSSVNLDTTLIILADPGLWTPCLLLETSMWEAALCTVQTTDVRNFSHGRHTWLHHRPGQTQILSLSGNGSHDVWTSARNHLPSTTRIVSSFYGSCGRLANVLAIIDSLNWIEAIGAIVNIDPGKPGVGEFGRALYDDPILRTETELLAAPVRQKLAALALADTRPLSGASLTFKFEEKLSTLCGSGICGLVLDYDGTMVTTEGRREPPRPEIIAELMRLHQLGLTIAFASGRGKSLGQAIRDAFPVDATSTFLIGYYNGGYLRSADVNIAVDRPSQDPVVTEIEEWFANHTDLTEPEAVSFGAVQVEVDVSKLSRPHHVKLALQNSPVLAEGRAHIVTSAHSFDIIPRSSSKLRVVEQLENSAQYGHAVISIGDSGSAQGNDHSLLARPFGISVDAICPDTEGCWSLFGSKKTGPDALLLILRAMVSTGDGEIRLDRDTLNLDITP
jgi:hydroxymethylpyrimidine pyrophosphatase-like HAD family hydrolase